jgi:MFS family permease
MSAILIASISVAPITRTAHEVAVRGEGFLAELREGWRFRRGAAVLLANTLQATVGQFMLGIFLALTPVYAQDSIQAGNQDASASYTFIEGAIGAGNLIGGFAIGLVGTRIALGRMIILGYAWTGACVAALALTGNIGLAIGLSFGAGVGNLAFVIRADSSSRRRR